MSNLNEPAAITVGVPFHDTDEGEPSGALRRAEQEARAAREELQHFLDTAVVPIHTTDKSGVITWANQAELDLLGYTPDEYIGHSIREFLVDAPMVEKLFRRVLDGAVVHDEEVRLCAKDGTIRHVLVSSRAYVKDGEFVSTRCFARDITERKRAEQERTRLIEDLTRTVRLNEMFAGVLAHDLRNPLNTVLVAGQLVADYVHDEDGARALQRLMKAATRMQHMIEQLLDVARARTRGGIPLECGPTDIGSIVRDVVDELRLAHSGATIESHMVGDLRGAWDANRLAQLVSNLVGNAIQHGQSGAPIVVRIDGTDADSVTLSVANAGTISEELLPILFAPFRSAQQRGGKSDGLGLGLFISDQIVRAHGGTLGVTSKNGRTEFTIVLPRTSARSAVASFDAGVIAPTQLQEKRPVSAMTDETMQTLVESIRDSAICMLDPSSHVMGWNTGAQMIHGYTSSEIIGQPFSIFDPRNDARAARPAGASSPPPSAPGTTRTRTSD
jgi:PAS domain S-box-containing protein